MGRVSASASTQDGNARRRRGGNAARLSDRQQRRAAPRPARLRRGRRRCIRPAELTRQLQHGAGGGGNWVRQDARLSRTSLVMVGESRWRGVDIDLHQGAATPAAPRDRAADPRRRGAPPPSRDSQGPRELSVPAQPRRRVAGRVRRSRSGARASRRTLGGVQRRRRHGRRRLARLVANAVRCREANSRPTRYVFDEGHHLFDAADSMFGVALSGQESIELRRWIVGPEATARGRRRGLAARLSDVASYDEAGGQAIHDAVEAARVLASDGWLQRVAEGDPFGAVERLVGAVRGMVYARATADGDAGYGLETELAAPLPALIEAAATAAQALEAVLAEGPDWLDGQARARVEGAVGSLGWRTETVGAWISLLARIGGPADPDFVDWLAVDRSEGRECDIGLHRRWLDPTRPLAATVLKPAHGVLVTSATLKGGDPDWETADARAGVPHLDRAAGHFDVDSPVDYAAQAEVLIVTDVKRGDLAALANAYARLIAAAGGGTLGLFTAIRRLRGVHARIADRLARDGLPLYAQHVDPIDPGTLVDMFRDEPRASLIGTAALRDGVDVPGESLRQVILEGVPWAKPTVLHAARRLAGGGRESDARIVRAKLAQAFGRLIRRADGRGAVELLSAAMPSRLLAAFPPGVPIARVPLDEAVARVRSRLSSAMPVVHEPATP